MASARPSRRTRRWTPVTAVAAALALAGCSATNPITTSEAYNVVDGVREQLGPSVSAQNLLVIAAGEGEPGVITGALSNQGREDVQVSVEGDGLDGVTIDVPSRGTVLLGPDGDEQIELDAVGAAPGSLLPVTFSTPDGGAVEIRVPVFDGTLPEYAEHVPAAG